MRLLRSWPAEVPDDRAHVADNMERLIVKGFRYDPWLNGQLDDVLLIEWDIAVSREDLSRFAGWARQRPDRPLVAPYRLYQTTRTRRPLQRPVWAHRYDNGQPVQDGAPFCHLFALGMVYLPQAAIAGFFQAMEDRPEMRTEGFTDGAFSGWWWRTSGEVTPICWDVRPVHLNYPMPRID